MFAAATREVVFGNPEVVRRINADFIPVALKAGQVNNPPPGIEGDLLAEIARSRPAPQGICTVNSDGKVLAWALSFDDDNSILGFLAHVRARYRQTPRGPEPVTAERFRVFPGRKLDDIADNGRRLPVPAGHPPDERCLGRYSVQKNTLVGRLIGRALDDKGEPVADTLRQENYMEARVEVSPEAQRQFARAAEEAKGQPFPLPHEFARTIVHPAFLGQLDVNPAGTVPGSENIRQNVDLVGRVVSTDAEGEIQIAIHGKSDIEGGQQVSRQPGDGRQWEHRVTLQWEGHIRLKGQFISELVCVATGNERLRWGNKRFRMLSEPDARHLMAGHPIDFQGGVRYGLIARPCSPEEVVTADAAPSGRMQVIQRKMMRLHDGLRRIAESGGNPRPLAQRMQQFGPLMQQQRLIEAEKLLDEVLAEVKKQLR